MKNEFKMSSTAAAVSSKKYHVVTEFYKTGRTRQETFECDRNFFNNMHNWIESLFARVCKTLKLCFIVQEIVLKDLESRDSCSLENIIFICYWAFMWYQSWRISNVKIFHYSIVRGSEFWFLWLFVLWNLPNSQNSEPLE